jgi:hypothetical protein
VISVSSAVKRTVTREPQIALMKMMPQMNGNSISALVRKEIAAASA